MTGFTSLEEARLYREQWQPFWPWSDLECTEVACTHEALVEDGRRMDACHGHLEARLADPALREWPHADRVEVWDGVMLFENRWQAPWTWRSVAMAARAYPDRRVRLVDCHLQVPTDPRATVHT